MDTSQYILIADDMPTVRKLIQMSLEKLGMKNFIHAKDGADAWEQLSSSKVPVGLVLSDWNMPNTTGYDFLLRVRADSRFKDLPFVMITAEAEIESVKQALKAGCNDYVVKPINADILREKLDKYLK